MKNYRLTYCQNPWRNKDNQFATFIIFPSRRNRRPSTGISPSSGTLSRAVLFLREKCRPTLKSLRCELRPASLSPAYQSPALRRFPASAPAPERSRLFAAFSRTLPCSTVGVTSMPSTASLNSTDVGAAFATGNLIWISLPLFDAGRLKMEANKRGLAIISSLLFALQRGKLKIQQTTVDLADVKPICGSPSFTDTSLLRVVICPSLAGFRLPQAATSPPAHEGWFFHYRHDMGGQLQPARPADPSPAPRPSMPGRCRASSRISSRLVRLSAIRCPLALSSFPPLLASSQRRQSAGSRSPPAGAGSAGVSPVRLHAAPDLPFARPECARR